MQISEEQFNELAAKYSDKWWRLSNLYYIKDKNGRKVLFKPNIDQETFFKLKHNRNIILKARQKGFTTLACIDGLDDVLFTSFFEAGIIAHTLDDAEKIFTNKVKFAYDNLPAWLRLKRKPNTDKAGMLRFPNDSAISVDTSFRGGTLQKLHVSEYGKICRKYPEKAKEIKTGAFEAVAMGCEITVESTAEGMTGDFYEMCERAQLKNNDRLTHLDFKFHFFAWHESEEYRLDPEFVDVPDAFAKYFQELEDDHGIKLDQWQRAWYVKKSEEQEEMKQEYPSYPEEAFLSSGRPVFNQQKLARDIKRARLKTSIKGTISGNGFEEIVNGPVVIYKRPVEKMAYAIGADIAEGLVDGDYSTATVLDKNFEVVATYWGHIPPDRFGSLLVYLAKFYNGAVLAPEVNNMGISVLDTIKREKYFKVYKREVKEELGVDIKAKIGWHTNIKTKMLMLDDLKAAFRDDVLGLHCEGTLREMLTLTIEDDGNVELNGKDRVVALAIAVQALKQATLEGEHKAFTPGKVVAKDVTRMTVEEKLKHYKKIGRE